MKVTPERHAALRRVSGLDPLTEQEVDTLIACVRERRLPAGRVLYKEGQPGDTLALVLEGELVVRRVGPRGTVVKLRRVVAGQIVGELVCVDPAPRAATVAATTDALVVELDRSSLALLIDHAPRIGAHLLGMIIEATTARLREIDDQISQALGNKEPPPPTPAADDASTTTSGAPHGWRALIERLRSLK